MKNPVRRAGRIAVLIVEDFGLWVILAATVVAAMQEIWHMAASQRVELTDLLLMFIYLEVISMVDVYWQSGKLPVRMPLYIAMVALARYLILDTVHMESWQAITIASAILILALAVLAVRFGHLKFPYPGPTEERRSTSDDYSHD